MSLSGRVALITGGGAGIGHEIAHTLAKHGADLIVVEKKAEVLRRVVDELTGLGRRVPPRKRTSQRKMR
ncbi:MAG: SDR family NAD(P)-dependent oxidoreductase [Sulfolobales archaeon]|nr:SDR family NAD(P)-dependent oxidoreductase [Sulfolobales archaeon]MCX8208101.1 SDR family NAD(P)-dependent oxidoreductase [Sulfolobales archaeon]MDW8010078.1 SDR family NAD(P)-dependent oxidoreductase [Sulfolobales archaeon]